MSLRKKIMLPTDLKLLGMTEIELKRIFGKPNVIDLDMDLLILTRMYPDEEEWTYFLNQSYWECFQKGYTCTYQKVELLIIIPVCIP